MNALQVDGGWGFLTLGKDCLAPSERWKPFRKGKVGEEQENKHSVVANFIQGWLALLYRIEDCWEAAGGRPEVREGQGLGSRQPLPVYEPPERKDAQRSSKQN